MAITRYSSGTRGSSLSPWRELEEMSTRLSRIFDDRWTGSSARDGGTWFPPVNVEETQDELVLTAELPGMTEEEIEIELENNILTVSGEKKQERQEREDRRFHLWERRYGAFQRSFTLPRTVSAEEIEARFKDGILFVHMPKVEEAKGRKISIRTEG